MGHLQRCHGIDFPWEVPWGISIQEPWNILWDIPSMGYQEISWEIPTGSFFIAWEKQPICLTHHKRYLAIDQAWRSISINATLRTHHILTQPREEHTVGSSNRMLRPSHRYRGKRVAQARHSVPCRASHPSVYRRSHKKHARSPPGRDPILYSSTNPAASAPAAAPRQPLKPTIWGNNTKSGTITQGSHRPAAHIS